MTFPARTQQDIEATELAANKNGWATQMVKTLEPYGRGTLRNGVVLSVKSDGSYVVSKFSIQEDGIAGLHHGRYVGTFQKAVEIFNEIVRTHPNNPLR